jgi:hypothetical protein
MVSPLFTSLSSLRASGENSRAPALQTALVSGLRHSRFRSYKMPLLNLVVMLIVVGVALWLVNRYIPMASSIKTILNVVVVVAVAVFVLKAAGLWGDVTSFRIGR